MLSYMYCSRVERGERKWGRENNKERKKEEIEEGKCEKREEERRE